LQHKQSRLGDLVLATKLLSADDVTSRALNLMGDPALDIGYQFDSVPQDSIDLAVNGLKMVFDAPAIQDFAPSGTSLSVQVPISNHWRHAATSVAAEVWRGEPDGTGSVLLDDVVLSVVAAHDSVLWTASIGSFTAGDHEIYVTVDPDGLLEDPVPGNNVSWRTLHVRDYAPGFPRAVSGRYVNLVDAILETPRKLEIAVGAGIYTVSSLYSSQGELLPNSGLGGIVANLYRTDKRYVVRTDNLSAPMLEVL
jgi:hypothetical protein